MNYLGIDPGKTGGLAIVDSGVKFRQFIQNIGTAKGVVKLTAMPSTERDVWDWFCQITTPVVAVIEQVHSMTGQGVASTFKFGMGYGGLRMALIAMHIPFEAVTPRKWQKALSIPPRKRKESNSQWKNRLKAKAQELYPDVSVTLKTADALLIAEYARRTA